MRAGLNTYYCATQLNMKNAKILYVGLKLHHLSQSKISIIGNIMLILLTMNRGLTAKHQCQVTGGKTKTNKST